MGFADRDSCFFSLEWGAQGGRTAGCRWRSGLDFLDETDEAMDLILNAFVDFRTGEISRRIQRLVNLRYENSGWENMRVAVAKNLLQLLHRAQGAPGAGRNTRETDGFGFLFANTWREVDNLDLH